MQKLITTEIKPSDINPKRIIASKWQNSETETSAYYLIKMAQKHKSWRDFTKQEIDKIAKEDFWFNRLIEYGDIVENIVIDTKKITPYKKDNKLIKSKIEEKVVSYSFTNSFIEECYRLTHKK